MVQVVFVMLAATLGFAVGAKYMNCLRKKNEANNDSEKKSSLSVQSVCQMQESDCKKNLNDFSLQSISEVFRQYSTSLNSSSSFILLLDSIERMSYISLLKEITKQVDSAKEFYNFLNNENFSVMNFDVQDANSEPFITNAQINEILEKNDVDPSSLSTPKEKIQFLLALYQGKGIKRFQESFGNDLSLFIERFEANDNVDILYDSIINTIKRRLEYMI